MKIFCTKYAFTDGIVEYDAEVTGSIATVRSGNFFPIYLHGEGKDWHRTKEAAIERAEEMRIKKLKSLDKQMKKISAINFNA